ncbi:acyl-CoA thioesterase [Methylobacterium gnaphalii]|uniref:Thioesterase n=1 Tax=Methylobacterium gnaphalii TaxID=1010610 RepID=A0A512JKI8_9HYPH|nr:thioesterase family protein [Methylobacterium gnaphalii]GEP10450.1 thioesterase [Methylobacterium gnaphalii]GJD70395.1 1,4-dihydroxy-2-naphthoyl-CoA hydrolase [Methylobacterium gnaphalii]GLS47787.1 thioesterase [Methylobacterium gnaphalii]
MNGQDRPARETRADFAHFRSITTRWAENDVYGHVNNVVYYAFFDTVVAGFHVESGLLDVETGAVIGLVVETGCRYFAPIAFPDRVEAGLRVTHLGRSSVRYEIGIFRNDEDQASAQGYFVHVYVDRQTRRPVPLPDDWRDGLARLLVPGRDGADAGRSP